MSKPPQHFDFELAGRASMPSTEVVIKRCLLEKIPLLRDISSNTSDVKGVSEAEHPMGGAEIELPCSVWGLVSLLLLLLEGCVVVKDWFEANWQTNDPSLPAQTLEVRFFPHESGCLCLVFSLSSVLKATLQCVLDLQIADFLGCKDLKTSLLGCLQQVVKNVTGVSKHIRSAAKGPTDMMQS